VERASSDATWTCLRLQSPCRKIDPLKNRAWREATPDEKAVWYAAMSITIENMMERELADTFGKSRAADEPASAAHKPDNEHTEGHDREPDHAHDAFGNVDDVSGHALH